MNGTLLSLVVVEGVMTAIVVGIVVYRSTLDMREEDHIVLDDAESHLVREQAVIRRRATTLTKYLKVTGALWGVLLLLIFGVWVFYFG